MKIHTYQLLFAALLLALPTPASAKRARSTNSNPALLVWPVGNGKVAQRHVPTALKLGKEVARTNAIGLARTTKKHQKKLRQLAKKCAQDLTAQCIKKAAKIASASHVLVVLLRGTRKEAAVQARLYKNDGAEPIATATDTWRRRPKRKAMLTLAKALALAPSTEAVAKRDAGKDGTTKPEPNATSSEHAAVASGTAEASPALAAATDNPSHAAPPPAPPAPGEGSADTLAAQAAAPASFDVGNWQGAHGEDPVLYHALAMNAELDGNVGKALELVRRAHGLSPEDAYFAFELARLSYDAESPTLSTDAQPFIDMRVSAPAERAMKGRVLERLGRHEEAKEYLDALQGAGAGGVHATLQLPGERKSAAAKKWLSTSLRAMVQYDTNVSVLPEDFPTHDVGVRSALSGMAALGPQKVGGLDVTLFAAGQYSRHVNDRDNLFLYDVGAATAGLSAQHKTKNLRTTLSAMGSEVFLEGFVRQFMQDAKLRAETRMSVGKAELGIYGAGGYRDFVYGNEKGAKNRDGATWEAGLVGAAKLPHAFTLRGTLGGQLEWATGRQQRERGALLMLALGWRFGDLNVSASLDTRFRHYPHGQNKGPDNKRPPRTELRITPTVGLKYGISGAYAVVASASTMKNYSNAGYGYSRQMLQLGVETRW